MIERLKKFDNTIKINPIWIELVENRIEEQMKTPRKI